jgi:hypothetical protein
MIVTRHRLPRRTPLRSRQNAQAFPRWLPLVLHWKPAAHRAPRTTPPGKTILHFNTFATHLHAELKLFAGTVPRRTRVQLQASAEKIFRISERAAPPPRRTGAQLEAAMPASVVSTWRETAASVPRIHESPMMQPAPMPNPNPQRVPLDPPRMRPAGAGRAAARRNLVRPTLPAAAAAAPPSIARAERPWSSVALTERQHDIPVQPGNPEPPARSMHAEFFSAAPELIWRKVPSPRLEAVEHAVALEQRLAGKEAAAVAARPAAVPAPPKPEILIARKPTALSDLEPSFVDRLADDVIRRVERRARIERERRGL